MAVKTKLPVGIENFAEIRTEGFYYIDKTGLIKELLENPGKVSLFTRPGRFGKTLNMSMLKYFFGTEGNEELFDGLVISKEKELCDKYMGKFPVISISLKDVDGRSFDAAKRMLCMIVGTEALKFSFLLQSENLTEMEHSQYKKLTELNDRGEFAMSEVLLKKSLLTLSQLLQKHYGRKAVILIDEYDVPLDKAFAAGYYDEMVDLLRGIFGQALKTNDSLFLAVLTGCLRVSKESIFTGLNNFKVFSVKDVHCKEYFGFTDEEVQKLLAFYNWSGRYDTIKEWYDGYHFGNQDIYCPWDVINYCFDLKLNPSVKPQNYWINTSSNNIIRRFINKANSVTKKEIELLMEGGSIKKEIRQDLTYRDLDSGIDNLWSILFTTGYLTQRGEDDGGLTELVIPNKEIRWIFAQQIHEWFKEETAKDSGRLESFCRAFMENDVSAIEEGFTSYLKQTISIRDTYGKKEMKENFYHGILLGLFGYMDGWIVSSNAESGKGDCDIIVEDEAEDKGFVIEVKYAENGVFDDACRKALGQIKDRDYEEVLRDDGMKTIYRYGIACYKKRCRVVAG